MKKINMQKIRSGQSFCYRENGLNSTIIEITIKGQVWGSFLSRALTKTIKRYPYFAGKLVEKNGDFYLADNSDIAMIVRKKAFSRLGSLKTGFHLIEVSYSGSHIYIAFHHAICDGRGIQPFIETLIYYYFCFAKNKKFKADVRKSDSPLLEGETREPFKEKYSFDEGFIPPVVVRDGFALPECAKQNPVRTRYDIKIDEKAFLAYARTVNATPSVLLSYFYSKSVAMNNAIDKPVVTSLATDMRQELNLPNTHKNCVRSIYLSFGKADLTTDTETVCTRMRQEIKAQREPNYVRSTANTFIELSNKLDTMNSLEEKKKFMSFFDKMTINTYIVSYMGTFDFGECNQFIESVFLLGGETGVSVDMICAGGNFCVSFIQNIDGEKYIRTFLDLLKEVHIPFDAGELKPYTTPKDVTQKTAKWHAERYRKKLLKASQ